MTINVTALMRVRELLGWNYKAVEFDGNTLVELLRHLVTKDGKRLYDVFVREDGSISPEYAVWLNCRPVKPAHSLEIPLEPGDRVVAMPVTIFRAGG
jgi:hypothetical protein